MNEFQASSQPTTIAPPILPAARVAPHAHRPEPTPALEFRYLQDTFPDWDRVELFVSRCDPGALRTRFFVTGEMDPDDMLRMFSRYLLTGPPEGVALLASVGEEPAGLLNFIPTGPRIAEAGVLVAPRFQRRGVGRALVAELGRDPRWSGWTMRAVMQWDNTAVRGLVRSLPGSRRTASFASGCVEVDLQPFGPENDLAAPI
ncbi:MAG: GNAT family N-acetyltransferase [Sporichthyaceae bacterium]